MLHVVLALALAGTGPEAGGPAAPRPHLERAWSAALPARPVVDPFPLDDCDAPATLVALAYRDAVEARRAEDGSVAWRVEGAGIAVSAAGRTCTPWRLGVWRSDGAGQAGELLVLDPADGRVLVRGRAAGRPAGAPVAGPGDTGWLLPLADGRIALFDDQARPTGHVALGAEIGGAIVFVAGRALVAEVATGRLLRADGGPLGARRLDGLDLSRAAADGPLLVAAGPDERLVAARCTLRRRDRMRCRRRWVQRLAGSVAGRPLVGPEVVHVVARDTHVYAFRRDNGHLVWRSALGFRPGALAPLGDDLLLVTGEKAPTLVLVRREDGAPAGRFDAAAGNPAAVLVSGPVAVEDAVLVVVLTPPAVGPELVAFRLAVGENAAPPAAEEAAGGPAEETR